jgi:hypothetical protein
MEEKIGHLWNKFDKSLGVKLYHRYTINQCCGTGTTGTATLNFRGILTKSILVPVPDPGFEAGSNIKWNTKSQKSQNQKLDDKFAGRQCCF